MVGALTLPSTLPGRILGALAPRSALPGAIVEALTRGARRLTLRPLEATSERQREVSEMARPARTLPRHAIVCGLALSLGLLGCARGSASQTAAAPPAPAAATAPPVAVSPPAAAAPAAPQPVRAAFTSFSASAAPWWMALEGGYFREQGLDV